MLDTHPLPRDEREAGDRQTGDLVGPESEADRLREFLATARTDGAAVLVTVEPGVGKRELLDAASDAPNSGLTAPAPGPNEPETTGPWPRARAPFVRAGERTDPS